MRLSNNHFTNRSWRDSLTGPVFNALTGMQQGRDAFADRGCGSGGKERMFRKDLLPCETGRFDREFLSASRLATACCRGRARPRRADTRS